MLLIDDLLDDKRISPPKFLPGAIDLAVIMGSMAYGVSNDRSDCDVHGITVPPKEIVFPHLAGLIPGFDRDFERFDQWQEHNIQDLRIQGRTWDFCFYSIVKFFSLAEDNNPEKIDMLFVPKDCILYSTPIGLHIMKNRHVFLNKKAWHTYKGYAHAQLRKLHPNNPDGKRGTLAEQYGYDIKSAYHVVRLMGEIEQIMVEGDLDLRRNCEVLKEIRRGEWSEQQIRDFFLQKEKELESVYVASDLPKVPEHAKIKKVLVECLEMAYGNLDEMIVRNERGVDALKEIQDIASRALK